MSETPRGPGFFPGDEIKLSVSFTHAGNPVAVDVVYTSELDESRPLTLSGNPDLEDGSRTYGRDKQSVVVVSGVVDVTHRPGVYRVTRLVFYQFSGAASEFSAPDRPPHPGVFLYRDPETGAPTPLWHEDVEWPTLWILPESPGVAITDVQLEPDVHLEADAADDEP